MSEKKRKEGDKFFIDNPIKIDNKLIFDGRFFLGERTFYKVERATGNNNLVFSISYGRTLVKVRPTLFSDKKWSYDLWGNKQDLHSEPYFFTDEVLNKVKRFYS